MTSPQMVTTRQGTEDHCGEPIWRAIFSVSLAKSCAIFSWATGGVRNFWTVRAGPGWKTPLCFLISLNQWGAAPTGVRPGPVAPGDPDSPLPQILLSDSSIRPLGEQAEFQQASHLQQLPFGCEGQLPTYTAQPRLS